MDKSKQILFKMLFINGYEYYFDTEANYIKFMSEGINTNLLREKAGTLCLKILSKTFTIIDLVDECEKSIYLANNMTDIKKAISNLKEQFNKIDVIFSGIATQEVFEKIEDKNKIISNLKKEIENRENDNFKMDLTSTKKIQLKDLSKMTDNEFVCCLLDEYIYSINNARLFIEYYYNLFSDNNTKENLKNYRGEERSYSLQALTHLTLKLPASEKIIYIISNDNILPATSYLNKMFDSIQAKGKKRNEIYFSNIKELYSGNMNFETPYYANIYDIYSIKDLLNASIEYFINNKNKVNKCKNCGNYFIPINKNNETLCNNIYKNRKDL